MDLQDSSEPPPYHEVINQRKETLITDRKYIKPPVSSRYNFTRVSPRNKVSSGYPRATLSSIGPLERINEINLVLMIKIEDIEFVLGKLGWSCPISRQFLLHHMRHHPLRHQV